MTNLEQDVLAGLSANPKFLPSKYFYDEQGSKLFQDIMGLPEYYLTRSELEVMQTHCGGLLSACQAAGKPFDLIEFGAGDGLKTKVLLHHFTEQGAQFNYLPIDISGDALDQLVADLKEELPELQVTPLHNDYFGALGNLEKDPNRHRIVLFLGSNIGNFSDDGAVEFLSQLRQRILPGDQLLVGFDLKKDPRQILAAYNDARGVTAAFNLNLLKRINRELDANFDLDGFSHYPLYDPVSGEARSYLISLAEQEVTIGSLGHTFSFALAEPIHTEVSRKYDSDKIKELAARSGFEHSNDFQDSNRFFMNALWVAV